MIFKVNLGNFQPNDGTYVFSASALDTKFCHKKYLPSRERTLEIIGSGVVSAVITPFEINKLKNYIGESEYFKKYYSTWRGRNARVFYVGGIDAYLDRHEELYKLYLNHNMHRGDLSSVLVAIECMLPLVTNDSHHWSLQQKFQKIFKNRHSTNRYFIMLTSQDFCKEVEKI